MSDKEPAATDNSKAAKSSKHTAWSRHLDAIGDELMKLTIACGVDLREQGVIERIIKNDETVCTKPNPIGFRKLREPVMATFSSLGKAMDRIGLESPKGALVSSLDDALDTLIEVGLPAVIRPSFTLGGTGGGIAHSREDFIRIVEGGLRASPVGQVLVEESVLGWKEFEMEVVRDRADNCIIICSIENIDPMGVHTGDSITVAPALTLTDKEYQIMRNASNAVLREIGVETGGSNVQFAVNPDNGRLVVIEMNPRVSRSSALASKATGFPIAKIAAKLAVGYTLDELRNDITRETPACFEPTIDYVVTKIPRFTFEKFPQASDTLGPQMKSVGEAMAIGRTMKESFQKAMRSLEIGSAGFEPPVNSPSRIITVCPSAISAVAIPRSDPESETSRMFAARAGSASAETITTIAREAARSAIGASDIPRVYRTGPPAGIGATSGPGSPRWLGPRGRRQAERDEGKRPGLTTDERERIKALEREVRELRQANEILRKASAYFAAAELDRPFKK